MGIRQSGIIGLKKQITRRLLKNYHVARMHYHHKLYQKALQYNQPPLLIYQMGKVGSRTIRESLKVLNVDRQVFHVHFLAQERVRELEKGHQKYFGTKKQHLLNRVWQCQYLRKQIAKDMNGGKWKIVTLTRDPISRNISTFFQQLEVERLADDHCYRVQSDYYDFEIVLNIEYMDELVQLFFERPYHDRPLMYFDQEIKSVLGIDVYSSEFPISKGYKVYKGEHADVLLIRLENLNSCARDAFKEFLGIEEFSLTNTNIGSEKVYAPIYKRIKGSIILPDSYMDKMYTSKYARHFYSEEEIARFRARWMTSRN